MGGMTRFALITAFVAASVGLSQFTPAAHSAETQPVAHPPKVDFSLNSREIQLRWQIYNQVKALLAARDYAGLNALEKEYRTTRARTPGGTWKLAEFYAGLFSYLPAAEPSNGCSYIGEPVIQAWIAASPDVPAPYIAAANMLLGRAWCFRGAGYAGEVSENAWQPFRENISAASKILTEHKGVASLDPAFYAVMEDIYRAEGREPDEFRQLMDEATGREPYYYALYYNSYFYFQPQWHGSIEDIDAAARYAVEKTRKQDGLGAYARFYWFASSCGCRDWVEAVDWDMMKLAMRDIAERYPDPWNLANFARFGCMRKDREVTRAYFEALGEDDGKAAWDDEDYWRSCRNFAFVASTQ